MQWGVRTLRPTLGLFGLLVMALSMATPAAAHEPPSFPEGWWSPTIGRGRGVWDIKVGAHVWTDKLVLRNLRLRASLDLGPGLRANAIIRSNQEFTGISPFAPRADELFLERFAFYHRGNHSFAASLRLGRMRYLRFPYPDQIATFDQVPGMEDLRGRHPTGYSGLLAIAEYKHASGLGAHITGIEWAFDHPQSRDLIEAYGFYHTSFGRLLMEVRAGILAVRPEPLGRGAPGYNVFVGYSDPEWEVGFLYEQVQGEPTRTGVMLRIALPRRGADPKLSAEAAPNQPGFVGVQVPLQTFAQVAGEATLDYTRSPQGIGIEIPIARGRFGDLKETPPAGAVLVGEIIAERVTTYWQNGQSRNGYEHVQGGWGETTDPSLTVVMKENPWRLHLEALVSPNILSVGNFEQWERQRQGPAQLAQRVVYQFYR